MTPIWILASVFVGLLLAQHYKVDKLTTVLGSVLLGWVNVWAFLFLHVGKGFSTVKSLMWIVLAYLALFCVLVGAAILVAATRSGTVLG